MSFVGNLFGGNSGMGWNASGTQIDKPVTTDQTNTAYGQTQQGLQNQAAFLQALQGQGGIANQSSVFGQQQGLADTLGAMGRGEGPNPALNQLNTTTGQNTAATAALIAGGRGASTNPGLAGRTAALAGAGNQQAAAGQAATMRSNQQLAALGQLGTQQQNMGNLASNQVANQAAATNAYSTSAQNEQSNLLNSINAQNNANVTMQSNINNANAGINVATAGAQKGLLGGLMGGVGSALQLPGAGAGAGAAAVAATGGRVHPDHIGNNPMMFADGGVAPKKVDDQSSFLKGFSEGFSGPKDQQDPLERGMTQLGSGIGSRLRGGKSAAAEAPLPPPTGDLSNPYSSAKDLSFDRAPGRAIGLSNNPETPVSFGPTSPSLMGDGMAKGGKVPAMLSPGEKYLTPHQAQKVVQGKENPLNGKTVPGKAVKKGDSYDNDVVPATLEEGGCVIPRSVLQSDQPMKNAIKFVHDHMKKMAKGGKVKHEHKPEQHIETEATEQPMEAVHPEMAIEVLRKPHFLFSPANPLYKVTKHMSPDQVLEHLNERGYMAEPAIGKYGSSEPSIMVHGVEEKHVPHLLKLAQQLGQESAIYSKNGEHEAHILNGPNKGMISYGRGTDIFEKEPEDFYTKTKNGLIFSHKGLDFDNPEPPRRKK